MDATVFELGEDGDVRVGHGGGDSCGSGLSKRDDATYDPGKEEVYDPSVVMNKATIQAMVIKDENGTKATYLKSLANAVNLRVPPLIHSSWENASREETSRGYKFLKALFQI